MTFIKPPFFNGETIAARGLAVSSSPPPVSDIGGVNFDGLSYLLGVPANVNNTATAISIAFWSRTTRVSYPNTSASFGEAIMFIEPNLSFARLQVSTQGNRVSNKGGPAITDWGIDAFTRYRKIGANWPGYVVGAIHQIVPQDSEWMFNLITLKSAGSNQSGQAYVNGVSTDIVINQQGGGPDEPLALNGRGFCIGGTNIHNDTDWWNGDIAEVWIKFVDLTEPDGSYSAQTIAKFMQPFLVPKFLGENGEAVTGSPADYYHHRLRTDPLEDFFVNRGTGGGPLVPQGTGIVTAANGPIPDGEPQPLVNPVASGSPQTGATLTVTNGTWINSPTAYSYQWMYDFDNPIDGEVANQLVVPGDAVGFNLFCIVTANNAIGGWAIQSNAITILA